MADFIIRNFQSIEEAKIRVEGLTLIIGQSSQGKSSCLKAIYAATHNRFRNGQVRYGEDNATVKVRFPESEDTLTVVRPWSGSIKMALGKDVFNKIGRTLPNQIDQFLNFGSLDVGGEKYSLHFHDQFQKPLLLEFSQKKVMEILSASQGVDDLMVTHYKLAEVKAENKGAFKAVDSILSNANAELSEVKRLIDKFESKVLELENSLRTLDSIDAKYSVIKSLEELQDKLATLVKKESKLLYKLDTLQRVIPIERKLNALSGVLNEINQIRSYSVKEPILERKVSTLESLVPVSSKLSTLKFIEDGLEAVRRVNKKGKYFSSREKILTQCVALDIQPILNNLRSLDMVMDNLSIYSSYCNRESELVDIVENHICPLCHSKVN